MALDYFFHIRAAGQALSRELVCDALVRGVRLRSSQDFLLGEHIQVSVLPPEDWRPLRVAIRIDKWNPYQAEDEMLGVVLHLVDRFQPDAQLSFEGEVEILTVAEGRISPNEKENEEFWTASRLARLDPRRR